jgi:hypothetical protein
MFAATCAALAVSLLWAEVDLTNAKCPVSGGPASAAGKTVDYKGGKIYFCCPGCDSAFSGDTKAYATKANHQLYVTGQAKQIACPLTGEPINPDLSAKIAKTSVAFCCEHCREAAEQADEAKKLEMVFGDEAFEKGFKVGD